MNVNYFLETIAKKIELNRTLESVLNFPSLLQALRNLSERERAKKVQRGGEGKKEGL